MEKNSTLIIPNANDKIVFSNGRVFSIEDLPGLTAIERSFVRSAASQRYNKYFKKWSNLIKEKPSKENVEEIKKLNAFIQYWEIILNYIGAYNNLKKEEDSKIGGLLERANVYQQIILHPLLSNIKLVIIDSFLATLRKIIDAPFNMREFKKITDYINNSNINTQPFILEKLTSLYEKQEYEQMANEFAIFINDYWKLQKRNNNKPPMKLKKRWQPPFASNILLFKDYILLQDDKLHNVFFSYLTHGLEQVKINGEIPLSIRNYLTVSINIDIAHLAKRVPDIDANKEFLFLVMHAVASAIKNKSTSEVSMVYNSLIMANIYKWILDDKVSRKGLSDMANIGIKEDIEKTFCTIIKVLLAITSPKYAPYNLERSEEIEQALIECRYNQLKEIYDQLKDRSGYMKILGEDPNVK